MTINTIYPLAIISISSFFFFKTLIKSGETYYFNPIATIISTLIHVFLLFGAGFFAKFGWPQIIWLVLSAGGVAMILYDKKEQIYKPGAQFFGTILIYFLYYKGGAFQYL